MRPWTRYTECLSQHGVDPSAFRAGGFGHGAANGSRPTGGTRPGVSRGGTRPADLGSLPGGATNAEGSPGTATVHTRRGRTGRPRRVSEPPTFGHGRRFRPRVTREHPGVSPVSMVPRRQRCADRDAGPGVSRFSRPGFRAGGFDRDSRAFSAQCEVSRAAAGRCAGTGWHGRAERRADDEIAKR